MSRKRRAVSGTSSLRLHKQAQPLRSNPTAVHTAHTRNTSARKASTTMMKSPIRSKAAYSPWFKPYSPRQRVLSGWAGYCLLFTVFSFPFTVFHLLFTVYCLPFTVYGSTRAQRFGVYSSCNPATPPETINFIASPGATLTGRTCSLGTMNNSPEKL